MKIDIKSVTEATGLNQIELAKKVGCTAQYLTNLQKSDKISKPFKVLYKLSALSKIPMNKLFKR
jgi:transcriptional regulator with XRE-family HTH domain